MGAKIERDGRVRIPERGARRLRLQAYRGRVAGLRVSPRQFRHGQRRGRHRSGSPNRPGSTLDGHMTLEGGGVQARATSSVACPGRQRSLTDRRRPGAREYPDVDLRFHLRSRAAAAASRAARMAVASHSAQRYGRHRRAAPVRAKNQSLTDIEVVLSQRVTAITDGQRRSRTRRRGAGPDVSGRSCGVVSVTVFAKIAGTDATAFARGTAGRHLSRVALDTVPGRDGDEWQDPDSRIARAGRGGITLSEGQELSVSTS